MATIFAVSSGTPPAAIAILRLSGPDAFDAVQRLIREATLPAPRYASLRKLFHPVSGALLDNALILLFPGPASATGEDIAELHLHGGRAVVRAVEEALEGLPNLRLAEPGEFTRRALVAGRIDLTEAEALADLLSAETEAQRRVAIAGAEGALRRLVESWTDRALDLAASVEAIIDHGDEVDVGVEEAMLDKVRSASDALASDICAVLSRPPAERLHHGIRVVLAGPPNAGKSSLINALAQRDVAIVSPLPGTTRDRIEVGVQHGGVAWLITDTAGLAVDTDDVIERVGIELAQRALVVADIVLWLGDDAPPDAQHVIPVHPRMDAEDRGTVPSGRIGTCVIDGRGVEALWAALHALVPKLLPRVDEVALNQRQRRSLTTSAEALKAAAGSEDPLIIAEDFRRSLRAFDVLTGRAHTEAMLSALFSQFCIGK